MQDPQTCTFSPFHSFSHMTTWWPPPELVLVVLCHGQIFPVCLQCSVSQAAEIKAGAPVHPDRPILNHSISIGGLSHLTSCLALWMRPDLNAHRNLLLKQLFPHYPPSKRHKETENGTWSSWVIGRLAHYSWSSHSEIVINGRPTIDNEQYHFVLQARGWNYCVRFTKLTVKSINMPVRLSTRHSQWCK